MAWATDVTTAFAEQGIRTVAYLPDSILDDLITMVEADDDVRAVRTGREEEAVAILTGAWLAGDRGALVCQSSGLGNSINVLGSHAVSERLPFVGVVSRRGDLGDYNYGQVPAGYPMPDVLDAIGVRNRVLEGHHDVGECVALAARTAFSTHAPYVLFLDQTLTGARSDR